MADPRSLSNADEWQHLDSGVLRPSRSGAVCLTCQHFRYEVGPQWITLLACPMGTAGNLCGVSLVL